MSNFSLNFFCVKFCHSSLILFQDEANQKGGKWIVRLRKGLVSRCWENLILAILGEQFMVGEEICGAVVSIRFQVGRRRLILIRVRYKSSFCKSIDSIGGYNMCVE